MKSQMWRLTGIIGTGFLPSNLNHNVKKQATKGLSKPYRQYMEMVNIKMIHSGSNEGGLGD